MFLFYSSPPKDSGLLHDINFSIPAKLLVELGGKIEKGFPVCTIG
jgi:hypothetical protein